MNRTSTDMETQKFIEKLKLIDNTKYQILTKLRDIVLDNYPEVKERMMYGGIIFSHNADFGGLFVYKNHVSFEFSNGYKFDDPDKLLEGKGKFRRHLKFKSTDDIESKKVDYYVKQSKNIVV